MDYGAIAECVNANTHLSGYHAEEWNRFVIYAPSFLQASRVAAGLGWWLHCWNWVESAQTRVEERSDWQAQLRKAP